MNIEQRDLMLRLADFLEALPKNRLNMRYWYESPGDKVINGEAPDRDCGTVACAMGWLPAVYEPFRPRALHSSSGAPFTLNGEPVAGFDAAQKIFGIKYSTATRLFDPSKYPPLKRNSRKYVANRLRKIAMSLTLTTE